MIREVPSAYAELPPPPSLRDHRTKSNVEMLYYGLVVVAAVAVVLVIYNLVIIKCCSQRQQQQQPERATSPRENINRNLLASFKYKKGEEQLQKEHSDYECAVCLSVLEDGEEVRELPRCKHSFHANCIDMWLFSHFDCPLCRAPVHLTITRCRSSSAATTSTVVTDSSSQDHHSRENSSGISLPST